MKYAKDIRERSFQFSLDVIALTRNLDGKKIGTVLGNQLLRAGTSVGANVEEAAASYSRDEYSHGMNIALKEARERLYWLPLIKESNLHASPKLEGLIRETDEIARVLGSIVSKVRKKA